MAMNACKECEKPISSYADICPHCGVKISHSNPIAIVLIGIVVVLIFIAFKQPSQRDDIERLSSVVSATKIEPHDFNLDKKTWIYSSEIDTVSGKTMKDATIDSNNSINLDFPYNKKETKASLLISNHPRYGKAIIFYVNQGQLHCQYNNCYISIRFDDGDVINNHVGEAADNSNKTYFLSNYKKVRDQIKKSNKMYIEVTFFQQGSHTFEFNTENLDLDRLSLPK